MGADGTHFAVLGNTRKGLRIFASVTTIAMSLRRLGFDRFAVDARSSCLAVRVRRAQIAQLP